MRGKSEESDEKLEGKIGPVMEVHMDANATLSQLSYEPVELLCSSESYYTIISTVVKTIFFGTRKIFCCQFGHPIVK